MDGLTYQERPDARFGAMVLAFAGWSDAAEAATGAARYLRKHLSAKKLAEIDPEHFYDFSTVRPHTVLDGEKRRSLRWPANELYYVEAEEPSRGLIIVEGTEPNLRWRTFSEIIFAVAEEFGVGLFVSLGSLLDAVPHTREPRVTGLASPTELAQKMEWLGVRNSGYEGPAAIHTVLLDGARKRGLGHASIWGHCPHYVNVSPNPKVSEALLIKLRGLVDIEVDLEELRQAGEAYQVEVTKAVGHEAKVNAYVERLEQRYDATHSPSGEIPSPDALVQDLEDFLKSQRGNGHGES